MATCRTHPHSSPESARKCYEKTVGKRADRRIRQFGLSVPKYAQVKFDPPKSITIGGIEVVYFFSANVKQ